MCQSCCGPLGTVFRLLSEYPCPPDPTLSRIPVSEHLNSARAFSMQLRCPFLVRAPLPPHFLVIPFEQKRPVPLLDCNCSRNVSVPLQSHFVVVCPCCLFCTMSYWRAQIPVSAPHGLSFNVLRFPVSPDYSRGATIVDSISFAFGFPSSSATLGHLECCFNPFVPLATLQFPLLTWIPVLGAVRIRQRFYLVF